MFAILFAVGVQVVCFVGSVDLSFGGFVAVGFRCGHCLFGWFDGVGFHLF